MYCLPETVNFGSFNLKMLLRRKTLQKQLSWRCPLQRQLQRILYVKLCLNWRWGSWILRMWITWYSSTASDLEFKFPFFIYAECNNRRALPWCFPIVSTCWKWSGDYLMARLSFWKFISILCCLWVCQWSLINLSSLLHDLKLACCPSGLHIVRKNKKSKPAIVSVGNNSR